MKSTFYATREYFHRYGSRIVAFALSVAIVTLLSLAFTAVTSAQQTSFVPLTAQAGFGSRGTNVSNLQTFLASNSSFYPEGLVTGYYGSLTRAAVMRFQTFYGISATGYVGPITLARINALIAGGGTSTTDVSGPAIFNLNRTQTANSVTFTFNTNENASSRVAYGTTPLMFNEGDFNSIGFGPIGGGVAVNSLGTSTSHSVVVSGLNANTTYYFTVIANDAAGNASVWGPNNAIRTNQ